MEEKTWEQIMEEDAMWLDIDYWAEHWYEDEYEDDIYQVCKDS